VAVAKIGKHATSESGDTFEMVERPLGGLSLVLADGQRSGRGAKAVSNLVARKAMALLAEGVRDGSAARAAGDYLFAHRGGKTSSTLNIVSVVASRRKLVLTRNNPAPVFVARPSGLDVLDAPSETLGFREHTEPVVTELPVEGEKAVVVASDGLFLAGVRAGRPFDVGAELGGLFTSPLPRAIELCERLLARALDLDAGRPADDISILVLIVRRRQDGDDGVRRLSARLPL